MPPADNQQAGELCDEAFQLCLQGDYTESFKLYKKILFEVGDQSPDTLSNAGFVCRQLGIIAEANECFRRALEQAPNHREALINYLDMSLSLGGFDEEARRLLKRLNDIDPHSADVKMIVAKKCVLQNDRDLAKAILQEVIAEHSEDVNIHLLVAKTLLDAAFFQEVIDLCQFHFENESVLVSDLYGKALLGLGQAKKAEDIYSRALEKYPDKISLLCGLSNANIALERLEEARRLVEKALELFPDHQQTTYIYLFIYISGIAALGRTGFGNGTLC